MRGAGYGEKWGYISTDTRTGKTENPPQFAPWRVPLYGAKILGF
jgi:hypothetical protein